MPITPTNPFKGRQFPGEVIILCVRWYLRYPLAYEHVAELLAERGLAIDASCVWRWVQAYSPELNKRCRSHLKRTNKSYRVDETYSALSSVLLRRVKVPLALGLRNCDRFYRKRTDLSWTGLSTRLKKDSFRKCA